MPNIRIFITDDHLLVLEGLQAILESIEGIEVVGISQSAVNTMERLSALQPDLLISDYHMPNMDGQELLRLVKKTYPSLKVLMLSMHEEIQEVAELIKDKADGYILKNSGKAEFITAIHQIMEGEKYFSSSIVQQLVSNLNNPLLDFKSLSNQELKIAKLLVNGLSSAEVAEKLCISVNTVNTHRKRIYSKLRVNSLQELIRLGSQKGWLESAQ